MGLMKATSIRRTVPLPCLETEAHSRYGLYDISVVVLNVHVDLVSALGELKRFNRVGT